MAYLLSLNRMIVRFFGEQDDGTSVAIFFLVARNHPALTTSAEIEAMLGVSRSTVSRRLAGMSTQYGNGLIEYVETQDRRARFVRLAKKGRDLAFQLSEILHRGV